MISGEVFENLNTIARASSLGLTFEKITTFKQSSNRRRGSPRLDGEEGPSAGFLLLSYVAIMLHRYAVISQIFETNMLLLLHRLNSTNHQIVPTSNHYHHLDQD